MQQLCNTSFLLAAILLPVLSMQGQSRKAVRELRENTQVTLTGTLQVEPGGYKACFFIKTATPNRVMFDSSESEPKTLSRIEVRGDVGEKMLRSKVGQKITATGKLQLEAVSPYYCNGALLIADTITLANGTSLPSKPKQTPLPDSVTAYSATVRLIPKQPWVQSATDSAGNPLGDANLAGCSLNGGEDVLNCSCTKDFKPTTGYTITSGKREVGSDRGGFLQFGLDERARHPVTVHVNCVRH